MVPSMVQRLMLSFLMLLGDNSSAEQFNWISSCQFDSIFNIEQVLSNKRRKKKIKRTIRERKRMTRERRRKRRFIWHQNRLRRKRRKVRPKKLRKLLKSQRKLKKSLRKWKLRRRKRKSKKPRRIRKKKLSRKSMKSTKSLKKLSRRCKQDIQWQSHWRKDLLDQLSSIELSSVLWKDSSLFCVNIQEVNGTSGFPQDKFNWSPWIKNAMNSQT